MTLQEKIDYIDEFLTYCEDWMHGDDSNTCTKSRKYLNDVRIEIQKNQENENKKP